MGPEPESIWEVLHRQKDIQYSSRVASHIARQRQVHKLRHVVSELVRLMPDDVRNRPVVKDLAQYASRACTSCSSSPLGWTMKTTPRTSISARPGLAIAGTRAMPTPGVRCSGRRGTTRATRWKGSSCTSWSAISRLRPDDGLRTLGASPRRLEPRRLGPSRLGPSRLGPRRPGPSRLGPTPRSLRTNLGAFLGASPALATHGLDEGVEIIAAIVIRDLVTGLDILDRPDLDHVFHEIGFGIRSTGMIDVARPIPAVGAVDGPARVDLEHVAGIELVGGFTANLPAAVANDELPLLDCDTGEETQPRFGSADPKVTRR